MEPFSSTIVNSEILYQCQSGLLQERRRTLLCGGDGRWNPDPQSLCTGKDPITLRRCNAFTYPFYLSVHTNLCLTPVPDKSLPTAATVAITAVLCSLVAFVAGTVCGVLLSVCISRWNKKRRSSKPAPNTEEQQQTVAVYEEVDIQSKKIELKENVAYGPVKQSQKIELKENVAYGPVKQN